MPLTEYHFGAENPVDRIFYGRTKIEKASAMLFYEQNSCVQSLLHHLKYRGQQQIGDFLGNWYGSRLRKDPALPPIDWVLPVPLHWRKARKRGYNQCSRFARQIGHALRAPFSETILVRRHYGKTQTRLDRWKRWQSSREAFKLCNPRAISGKRVLLVDDVITTGATMEACCQALHTAGDVRIYLASMAVVY